MIGVIDYGMGNLRSVENALKFLDFEYIISDDINELKKCDKLILPGVGAFHDCMQSLKDKNLFAFILEQVNDLHKPLLGICLGMQMLFDSSDENGFDEGFSFIKGQVTKMIGDNLRIPQIGWNELIPNQKCELFENLSKNPYVYYVHSWYATNYDDNDLYGFSLYGDLKIPGLVIHDNVMGCQFHPEKSADDGLRILKYFGEVFS